MFDFKKFCDIIKLTKFNKNFQKRYNYAFRYYIWNTVNTK